MIALIQRVSQASVEIDGVSVADIGVGLMALVGVVKGDNHANAERLLTRLLGYRVFPDAEDRMNLSLSQIDGDLLLVPQFTLAADTQKGMRPSFTPAAPPEEGRRLFDHLLDLARARHPRVASGRFGADMQVSLVNEGPVTFWLEG
jgi:D-tyrosyl-tRNA(Tyr) deacylase